MRELDEQTLQAASKLLKAISDPTRMRILVLLQQSECAVNEIADTLQLGQSTVSHQLRLLKDLQIVSSRREGTMMYYRVADAASMGLLEQALAYMRH